MGPRPRSTRKNGKRPREKGKGPYVLQRNDGSNSSNTGKKPQKNKQDPNRKERKRRGISSTLDEQKRKISNKAKKNKKQSLEESQKNECNKKSIIYTKKKI